MHLTAESLILIFSTLASFIVGIFVFLKNPKSKTSQIYGILTLCLIFYPIFNYISLQTLDRLTPIRLVIFFASLSAYLQYLLVRTLLGVKKNKIDGRLLPLTAIVAILNLTPLVFSGLTEGDNPVPIPGILSPLFFIHFLTCIYLTVSTLMRFVRKSTGSRRAQAQLLLIGMTPIFLFSPFTSFVMPVLLHNSSLIFLSPIYGAFFVSMVGYAIVRHRMFDIGLVVARSVGYVLALFTLSALYIGGVYLVLGTMMPNDSGQIAESVVNILILFIAILSFNYVRQKFDKLTNRLFYRDAYEPQQLLDRLNKVLVGTIELDKLLRKSAEVIGGSIKSEFCVFVLAEQGVKSSKAIGVSYKNFDSEYAKSIKDIIPKDYGKVIVAEEISGHDKKLYQALKRKNIGVVLNLADSTSSGGSSLGWAFLGEKKSGGLYTSQDKEVLEIIADDMVIAIQNALRFREIEQFSETLQKKIDEATRELRRTNERLKELDETKDEFISMASHQLRTPLTSVKGYLSMVLEGDVGKITDQQEKLLSQAFTSSQRMNYLISDLLNVSRLRTGKFVIETSPTNLADIVEGEVDQLRETAKARELKLTYDKPKDFPILNLDETKIRQVIMNFIDNAIYYTLSGGEIKVELEETAKSIEYRVVDTGLGVPRHEQPKLFTKFYRADNAKRARPDGTGLGLFMAKKVVIAQGGAIIFKSTEGKGSTFGFVFPKTKVIKAEK